MINIDEVVDHYEGVAYLNPSTNDIPASVAYLSTLNKDEQQATTAHIFPIDPRTGFQCNWDEIKVLYGQYPSLATYFAGNRSHGAYAHPSIVADGIE